MPRYLYHSQPNEKNLVHQIMAGRSCTIASHANTPLTNQTNPQSIPDIGALLSKQNAMQREHCPS